MDTILLDDLYEKLFFTDSFNNLSQNEKDETIRGLAGDFAKENEVEDESDLDNIAESANRASNLLRKSTRIGRYVPTTEQASRIFKNLGVSFEEFDTKEDKIDQLESARGKIKELALKDPELFSHADDTDFLLNEAITQQTRSIKGEGIGRTRSFFSNIGQGLTSRIAKTFGQSDAGFRDYFTENPEFDDE